MYSSSKYKTTKCVYIIRDETIGTAAW